ncbi:MAG: glutamyl-tRNA reductase [Lachnospiraceae bacterium]
MFCISVSFKKTPLPIRQRFAFSKEEQAAFLSQLLEKENITGGVVLSTCNRSELYFTGDSCSMEAIEDALSSFKQIDRESIKKYCLYYANQKAVRHLFKVACGLDSMVLGEDEILRQVKEAYLLADKNGFTNSELNIIFQGAFNCAKLSKSETKLSNTPVSIGTLTAKTVQEYLRKNAELLQPDTKSEEEMDNLPVKGKNRDKVLVIGATGKIGSIVAKDLLAKGIRVIGTSRRRHSGQELFLQKDVHMEWLDFEKRYEALKEAAVVVSATASPHYTLIKEEFIKNAGYQRPFLLIDLAVPCDIDKELGKTEGITLLDIDYFKMLSEENNTIKLEEMEKAESILQECVEDVLKKLYLRDFQKKMADKCEEQWFQKMTFYLKDVLDSEQLFKVLEKIYQRERQEAE